MLFCSVTFSGFYLIFFVSFTKEYLYQRYFLLQCTYTFFNFFQKLFFPVLAKTLFILCLKSQILNPNLVFIILCFPYTFCNIWSCNHKDGCEEQVYKVISFTKKELKFILYIARKWQEITPALYIPVFKMHTIMEFRFTF